MAYTTINKSTDYFNTLTYTGDGSSSRNVTGVGFEPSLTWNKPRTTANEHQLVDAVRGGGKVLSSNLTDLEYTYGNTILSFGSDGFTCGNGASVNANGVTYASWNWKANGAGSANTDGSTNTVVSANTTSGFSIVTYSGNSTAGSTFGHGLGVKPSMIITKARTRASMWNVYHKGLTNYTKGIYLNAADAEFAGGAFADGEPNANTFTLSNGTHVNGSGETYVAYCFNDVQGYSKFGNYKGTGNADGPFVYTGFKPAFVLIKNSSQNNGWWQMTDNARSPFNVVEKAIFSNVTDSEYDNANYATDFVSNGFKLRNSTAGSNVNGDVYIYMAFAEAPLVGTNGVTAKAR